MKRRVGMIAGLAVLIAVAVLITGYVSRSGQYRALMAAGDEALSAGRSYAAIEAYSGALALRTDSMAAHLRRGEAYRFQRRDEEALRDLEEAARLQPQATLPMVALAEFYEVRGDAAKAADWHGRIVEVDGRDPSQLYKLGLARYRAGQSSGALDPLRRAIALDDSFAEAHYLLGIALRDEGQMDDAIASLERAVRVNQKFVAAREELAEIYRAQQRTVEEMAQLQALAGMDGQNVTRSVAIALAEARINQFDSALATLAEASRRAPDDSSVHLARGRVHLARAERSRDRARVAEAGLAIAALERALGGNARRSEGLALYGRALWLSADAPGAERILKDATATSPFDRSAFLYLADACEQLEHHAEAFDALLRLDVLEGKTAAPGARQQRAARMGALALRAGDAARALEYLDRATPASAAPHSPLVLRHLAEARWRTGDLGGARAALADSARADPRAPDLARLRRLIR